MRSRCVALAIVFTSHALTSAPGARAQGPQPLTLGQIVRSAMAQHPLVAAAEGRLRATKGSRLSARVLPNPIITWQVENAPFPGRAASPGMDREVQTFATLPLEALWQRWPRVARANDEVRGADAELDAARRMVAMDAARAFYRVALAQIALRGTRDIVTGLDSLVRFNRARVTEGVAAEGDLIRVEVESARAATDAALQEVELVRARAELFPFLDGASRASVAMVSLAVAEDGAMAVRPDLPALRDLESRALSLRPDVTAARARVEASRHEVQFQRTAVIRQLGATFGSKSVAGTTSMIAGISVPFPIFDQNIGEMQRASGERAAAEREVAWTERRAAAELASAYESAQILVRHVAQLEQGFLSRAEESRRIAVAAYQEGAAPLLQVIDASRTLSDARLTYYRAVFAQREGLLVLYNAAGLNPLDAVASAPSTGTSR